MGCHAPEPAPCGAAARGAIADLWTTGRRTYGKAGSSSEIASVAVPYSPTPSQTPTQIS